MDIFENEKADSVNFIKFLFLHRWLLIITLFLGLGAAAIVDQYLPKKYRSTGTVYPSNPHTRNQILDNPQFGYEMEAEHLLQLLESASVRDSVIHHFNLHTYYELDSSEKDWKDELNIKYSRDIQISRTRYMSVNISANTTNPQLSADIVNYIIEVVNHYKSKIFEENQNNELDYLKSNMQKYQNSLRAIKSDIYQIKDSTLSEDLIENHLLKASKQDYVEDNYINSPKMAQLVEDYKSNKIKYEEAEIEYQQALDKVNRKTLNNYVIDKASPSYKTSSPSLWVILAIGSLGSVLIILIGLAIRSKFLEFKAE